MGVTEELRRLIDANAPFWAGEGEVIRTYFEASTRTLETDRRWLQVQCRKEFWYSYVDMEKGLYLEPLDRLRDAFPKIDIEVDRQELLDIAHHFVDTLHQTVVTELLARQVDSDPQPAIGQRLPFESALARMVQDPSTQPVDESRLLGERDELGRSHQAQLRVLPAHQGLHADDRPGVHVDDGLVVDLEFTALGKRLFGEGFKSGRGFGVEKGGQRSLFGDDGPDEEEAPIAPTEPSLRTINDTPHLASHPIIHALKEQIGRCLRPSPPLSQLHPPSPSSHTQTLTEVVKLELSRASEGV